MSTQQYVTYRCSKCLRTKTIAVDHLTAFIDLCTITKNCDGRLKPIKLKRVRDVLASRSVDGLDDWTSRFIEGSSSASADELRYVDVVSSSRLELTLAVSANNNSGIDALPNNLQLSFTAQQVSASSFVEYSFYKTSAFSSILGLDSAGKKLSFAAEDTVKVFMNGVELDPGDFSLGFSDNGDGYEIALVEPRTTSTLVKVLVYKPIAITMSSPLVFIKNLALSFSAKESTAWSNVQTVDLDGSSYVLYTCQDTSLIPSNVLLNVYDGLNQITGVDELSQVKLLLAYQPYTPADRYYGGVISLDQLGDTSKHLKLVVTSTEHKLLAPVSSITYLEKPISILTPTKDNLQERVETQTGSSQETILVSDKIIGPF